MPTMYISNGGPGRLRIVINMEMVELLCSTNFTWDEIAKLVGVSRSTLWRKLSEHDGIPHYFSDISDDTLDSIISQYQNRNPHTGQTILKGYLYSDRESENQFGEQIHLGDWLDGVNRYPDEHTKFLVLIVYGMLTGIIVLFVGDLLFMVALMAILAQFF